jgi:hypothetical protein
MSREEKIQHLLDKQEMYEVISNWAFWRDRREFEKMKTCFHHDATISVSFYSGSIDGFITKVKMMGEGKCKHFIGNVRIEVNGERALGESDVIIMGRGGKPGMEIDTTSYARFFDFFEKRKEEWRIVSRTVIYERDRIDPVKPAGLMGLLYPSKKLMSYPSACRHLCFAIEKVSNLSLASIIVENSAEEKELFQRGKEWLSR